MFLKKFKSDPQNLVGPDLSRAPVHVIDLSGTRISFLCPPQTAQIPAFTGGNRFDISSAPEVEPHNKDEASALIFSSGWQLSDRIFSGTQYGGLKLKIILLHSLVSRDINNSLLKKQVFSQWVCTSNDLIFGRKNKEMWENRENYEEQVSPEKSFWQYPKSTDDLIWNTFNYLDWICYEIFQPGYVSDIIFETPISHQHVIQVSWSPNSYYGIDFFSSKHNFREATKNLMDAIMASMKIELSDEAKKQFIEGGVEVP